MPEMLTPTPILKYPTLYGPVTARRWLPELLQPEGAHAIDIGACLKHYFQLQALFVR